MQRPASIGRRSTANGGRIHSDDDTLACLGYMRPPRQCCPKGDSSTRSLYGADRSRKDDMPRFWFLWAANHEPPKCSPYTSQHENQISKAHGSRGGVAEAMQCGFWHQCPRCMCIRLGHATRHAAAGSHLVGPAGRRDRFQLPMATLIPAQAFSLCELCRKDTLVSNSRS